MWLFLTSKLGGYIAIAIAAISAAGIALLRAFNAGKRAELDKQKTAQLQAVKERKAVDEDVAGLSDDDVMRRLRDRWRR